MSHNLPKKLQKRPFTWAEAKAEGITEYTMRNLLQCGAVERLSRGVYRSTAEIDLSEVDQYKSAILRVGQPSAICLISALTYHQLTDIIPKKTWIMVNSGKVRSNNDIRLWRKRQPKWKIGIKTINGVKVTTIERTLVESIGNKNLVGGIGVAMSAVRLALEEKKVTVSGLLKMSEKLGVKNKIVPYLETLL